MSELTGEENIQLDDGEMLEGGTLGGNVTTQFIYRPDLTGYDTALAAVKADQEAMCGYALKVVSTKTTEQADAEGRFNEVFVTFAPAETERAS